MSFFLKLFKRKTVPVNLTICGLDKAGKSAMVHFLVHGEFRETVPTMGVNREVITFDKIQMNIFDLGGQVDFRPMWSQLNEKSDAMIYVVDGTDYLRFEETKSIFYSVINNQIYEKIPVLILLNKIDLPDRMNRIDFVKNFGLANMETELKWAVFETSAKTGEGLQEAFSWFISFLEEEVL